MKTTRRIKLGAFLTYNKVLASMHYGDADMFTDINIETQTTCNRKCVYCPNFTHERPYKKMSIALFRKIIDELSRVGYRDHVTFSGYGEPLIDKRLPDMSLYVREKLPKAKIRIHTNGDFLTPAIRKKLEKMKVEIKISRHDVNLEGENLYNRGGLVKVKNNCMAGATVCIQPLFRCMVFASGNVILCCNDYLETVKLGNVKKENTISLWKRNKCFRHNVGSGHLIQRLPVCRKCTDADSGKA